VGVVLPQPIQFGKYTLFERIGRGGMADVFKARVQGPAGFERVFVVKRILPHLSDDPTFTKMFIEEAKMSARLSHPNIVQVFELGAVDNEYFISMEYVRGRDLAETMRTLWARIGPPRPELVAYVGREMCRALAYAHDLTGDDGTPLGMIHRDVSPSNVMLSYDGAVKLLDFGIAKALGQDDKHEEESGTQRGTLKGKFAYMAPEQTQGSDVDRRIDIFATGIVLHEILTGRRLFKGENDLQTVEKVRQCDVPPPSLQNPLCPPELDVVVLKALTKHREDRFQTASEMADALDDVVHAARFQPSHLAQLMRDLFPAEAGGGGDRHGTGSVRVSSSLTGSQSRPYSHPIRSPTIPPVSRSVSASRSLQAQDLSSALPPPRAKPLYKRGSAWITAGLVAFAFVGGAFWMQTSAPVSQQAGASEPGKKVMRLSLTIQSIPDGAHVWVLNTNQYLGKTSLRQEFEWREDRQTILVFRLDGYEEVTKEVKPTWTGLVHLKPSTRGSKKAKAINEDRLPEPIKPGEVVPAGPPVPGTASTGSSGTGGGSPTAAPGAGTGSPSAAAVPPSVPSPSGAGTAPPGTPSSAGGGSAAASPPAPPPTASPPPLPSPGATGGVPSPVAVPPSPAAASLRQAEVGRARADSGRDSPPPRRRAAPKKPQKQSDLVDPF
jgi:serine/threonine protein kinase